MKIPYGKQFIDKDDIKAVSKALQKDFITQGPIIEQFEKKICRIVGSKYAVALSSCSAGLHLALASIKKNKKKEVITSPISFVSTANAIIHNKYNPVFLDIDKYSLNLCINKFENYINRNKNISAVIPVHLGGYAFNSKTLFNLAKKKKYLCY